MGEWTTVVEIIEEAIVPLPIEAGAQENSMERGFAIRSNNENPHKVEIKIRESEEGNKVCSERI
jgi:hypothetical protein